MTIVTRMETAEREIRRLADRAHADVAKMGAAHALITAGLSVLTKHDLLNEFAEELHLKPVEYSSEQLEEIYGGPSS